MWTSGVCFARRPKSFTNPGKAVMAFLDNTFVWTSRGSYWIFVDGEGFFARSTRVHWRPTSARRSYPVHWRPAHTRRNSPDHWRPAGTHHRLRAPTSPFRSHPALVGACVIKCDLRLEPLDFFAQPNSGSARNSARPMSNHFFILFSLCAILFHINELTVNVWLQSRSLPARGRVGLEVHRCLCIIDAGNVFISTVMG
jgi:hypothetical protein